MRLVTHGIQCCAALCLLITGCATCEEGAATEPRPGISKTIGDKPPAKEKWVHVGIQASVESIDIEHRRATLKGPQGNLVTLSAAEGIERFDEIKVGDTVQAEYLTFLRVDFREPTAEEKAAPLVILAEAGRAPKDAAPAGDVGAVVRAVVKVVGVDTKGKEVAIRCIGASIPATRCALQRGCTRCGSRGVTCLLRLARMECWLRSSITYWRIPGSR